MHRCAAAKPRSAHPTDPRCERKSSVTKDVAVLAVEDVPIYQWGGSMAMEVPQKWLVILVYFRQNPPMDDLIWGTPWLAL